MIIETLQQLFKRDLDRLKKEINLYQDENKIWIIEKNIANSAGNLCLHLLGNLNAFIGATFAQTNYIRHRDLEFSLKNISRKELINQIENLQAIVEKGLGAISDAQLEQDFPIVIWEQPTSMAYTLIHLSTHLNYHLGQINYHRRLLDA
ncbi:MAG: DUF1572 family protein [Bacteroidetes bacterium]|nr:DUF1572 family protein [Bacteroidota bacterium]